MRLQKKLDEAKPTNSKTDDILLKSITNDIFRQIKRSIDNYMYQIDIPEGTDKKWHMQKKQLGYETIVKELMKKKREIK